MTIGFYIGQLLLFLFYSTIIDGLKIDKKVSRLILFLITLTHILVIQSFIDTYKLLDSIAYIYEFKNSKFLSFSEIIREGIDREWGVGFMLYNKAVSYITDDSHLYYMITYVIIDTPFFWYFYKVSSNYKLSLLLYLFHPMLFWDSNYILRQHMAISLSAIVIYYLNIKKIAIPLTILAASMHLSALILLPFLIWKNFKISKTSFATITIIVGLSLFVMNTFLIGIIAQSDRYSGYLSAEKSSNLVPFLLLCPLVILLFFKRKLLYKELQESFLFEFLLYGLVITLFTMNTAFGRVTTYFVAFVPVAVSLLYKFANKNELLLDCYVLFLFAIEGFMLYLNCTNLFVGNLIQK